jgi:hypothetical protein
MGNSESEFEMNNTIMFEDLNRGLDSDGVNEALIRSEIRFWRDLIESLNDETRTRDSMERMHQALALAEFRLESMSENLNLNCSSTLQSATRHHTH